MSQLCRTSVQAPGPGTGAPWTPLLGTLWRLARDWYTGRLEPGYTRRDLASATAYFAEVGLNGSFWGLPD